MKERYWANVDNVRYTVTEGQELPKEQGWLEITKKRFEEVEEEQAYYEMYKSGLSDRLNGYIQECFQTDLIPTKEIAETIKQAFCDLVDDIVRIDKFLLDKGIKL